MDSLRTALIFCSFISYAILIIYVVQFILSFISSIIKKKPFSWCKWNPYYGIKKEHRLRTVIFSVLFLIGIAVPFISEKFANTKMGDFWEKRNYEEAYEATLYVDDVPMFCIATVWCNTDAVENNRGQLVHESRYTIVELFLPYGKSTYTDDEYYPDQKISLITVNGWSCKIKLKDIATEDSYQLLKAEVPTSYGEFCSSKSSDTYHLFDCKYVKRIESENLIYFKNQEMAEVLGYSMCEVCQKHY